MTHEEAFTVANLNNNYAYWRQRYNLEKKHPKIRIARKPKEYELPPLAEGEKDEG
jgi:hypothetical protein